MNLSAKEQARKEFIYFYGLITGLSVEYIEKHFESLKSTSIGEDSNWKIAKLCALMTADEALKSLPPWTPIMYNKQLEEIKIRWLEIEKELEKL